jgi:cobalt-zinc-cadmium efflux system membrane fusion protein
MKTAARFASAFLSTAVLATPPHSSVAQDATPHETREHEAEKAGAHEEHAGHDEHEEATVGLTPTELAEFGIEVEPAAPGTIVLHVSLPGEVQPNADRLAHIVPRYAGIVTEVRVGIGDDVRRGDVLAIVESDESLAPFEIRTLISGTVIQKHITLGEAVSRDQDVFVIADLDSVWVDLTVYQRDLARVAVGQTVRISAGHELPVATGVVSYVTPLVDEETRTATARVVLPNPDGAWRPGMFVTGEITIERHGARVAVPRTAVFTIDDDTVVFVESADGFRPRPVTLRLADETHLEIVAGLGPGERYVSRGGLTLKAELQKASFGHGHAH